MSAMMSRTNTTRKLALAMFVVAIAACREGKTQEPVVSTTKGGTSVSPAGADAARSGKSMVRVINALPSKHKVELTGNDHTLFSDVLYKQVTPYAEVKDDLIALRVLTTEDNTLLADDHEIMIDGIRYTALVLPDAKGGTQLRIVRDDVAAGAGKARLRVINASPTVKNADFAILGEKEALFTGVDFTDEAGFKDIVPATITLDVRQSAKSVKPMILKPLHLVAGRAYTIVIVGGKGAPVEALVFEDAITPLASVSGS
jgi:hypothetical protein